MNYWRYGLALGMVLTPALVSAQARPADERLEQLQRRLDTQEARIRELESRLATAEARGAEVDGTPKPAPLEQRVARQAETVPPQSVSPAQIAAASAPIVSARRLRVGGDLRLRYESNFGESGARDRDRAVLRARLRAAYALSSKIELGAQFTTGDPDDPNSTDITLSNFNDDLQVSLDQIYARFKLGQLQLHAGKFPLPFIRTDLVWDGDVSPQGASASWRLPLGSRVAVTLNGLYFIVDESVAGDDSDMLGGQVAAEVPLTDKLRLDIGLAYYDYSLRGVAGGDAGDFRTNPRRPDGRYLSDFDLANVLLALNWKGLGAKWPARLSADLVSNFGAATSEDFGYSIDFQIGRTLASKDWRIGYGYAVAETDAVLAAFAHDNTTLGSNYRQHTLSVDYVWRPNLLFNATLYHYRALRGDLIASAVPRDWVNRLRLNMLLTF